METVDIILESVRRTEFIVFLINSADEFGRHHPLIESSNRFRLEKGVVNF
jgi:hypothetical protein